MSKNKSESKRKKEEVLGYMNEILDPSYGTKFSSHEAMAKELSKNKLGENNSVSTSRLRSYLLDTDYVKIGQYYTISPMYHKNKYRQILKGILELTDYYTSKLEKDYLQFVLHTDEKNDIIIMELLKIIFPFDSIKSIRKDYRCIEINFNSDEFTEGDMEFLNNLEKLPKESTEKPLDDSSEKSTENPL